MAWERATPKIINSLEPANNDKQGPGSQDGVKISGVSILDTTANKKSNPGAFNWTDLDDAYFHGSGGIGSYDAGTSFKEDNTSSWFRDDGSTTT